MTATPYVTTAGRTATIAFVANTATAVVTVQAATLEVKLRASATAGLTFTVGQGTDPTLDGDGTYYLDPGESIKWNDNPPAGPVRAISAGAGKYSVAW